MSEKNGHDVQQCLDIQWGGGSGGMDERMKGLGVVLGQYLSTLVGWLVLGLRGGTYCGLYSCYKWRSLSFNCEAKLTQDVDFSLAIQ